MIENKLEIATIYIRSLLAIPAFTAIAMYGMYLDRISEASLNYCAWGILGCVLMESWKAYKELMNKE